MLKFIQKFWFFFKQALKGGEYDFTTGSLNKAIFLLAVPMILEMLMESLFAIVDIFFVSKISVDAVTTVGLTESVLTVIYSIAIGMSMAGTAMVARRTGEKNKEGASLAAGQALMLGVLVGVIMGIIGFFYAGEVLLLMGASPEVIASGVEYTQIMFGGNITVLLIFLLNGLFRGAGNAAIAMRTLILSNGINIILDPCLIMGWGPFPEMGIAGAATATNIGRGIGVVYQLYHILGGKGYLHVLWKHIKWNTAVIIDFVRIAAGGLAQNFIASASWIFIVRIISMFGSEAVAGYTIAIRILIFTFLPAWGMANAAATLVGQNLGANQPERAEKAVWRCAFYNMVFLLMVSIIFGLLAEDFVKIFVPSGKALAEGAMGLRYICLGYVFFAYGMVISQSFNGAGDTRTPTLINFICEWLFQVPAAYAFAVYFGWGTEGIYIAMTLAIVLLALVSVYLFRKGKWKLMKV